MISTIAMPGKEGQINLSISRKYQLNTAIVPHTIILIASSSLTLCFLIIMYKRGVIAVARADQARATNIRTLLLPQREIPKTSNVTSMVLPLVTSIDGEGCFKISLDKEADEASTKESAVEIAAANSPARIMPTRNCGSKSLAIVGKANSASKLLISGNSTFAHKPTTHDVRKKV